MQQKFGAAFHYFSAQRFLTRSNLSLHKQFAEKGTTSWHPTTYKGWWRMPVRVRPSKLLKVYLLNLSEGSWKCRCGDPDPGECCINYLENNQTLLPHLSSPHYPIGTLPPAVVAREKTPTRRDLVTTWIESDEGSKVTEQRTQQNSWIACVTQFQNMGKVPSWQAICNNFSFLAQIESQLVDCNDKSPGVYYTHAAIQDQLLFRMFL